MEVFWGFLFGGIAALVLVWTLARVIMAERGVAGPEFTGSSPERTQEELDEHLQEWDRSVEENDPL